MFESYLKPPISFPTLTGSIVTFNSQYAGLPLKSHTVALIATQSGSGTPSPDNVRPITGYSAINISHSDADTSNPTVHTIQIGSTVYGGEYDARTGVLTVTHKLAIFDGSEVWAKDGENTGRYLIPNWVVQNSIRYSNDHYQNICPTATTWAELNNSNNACNFGSSLIYKVDNSLYPTVEDFKNFLSQNNLQVCYPLATPEVINLGGMNIETLQGVNNIWADTGDTTLQYIKFG